MIKHKNKLNKVGESLTGILEITFVSEIIFLFLAQLYQEFFTPTEALIMISAFTYLIFFFNYFLLITFDLQRSESELPFYYMCLWVIFVPVLWNKLSPNGYL